MTTLATDRTGDASLRPADWQGYIGQRSVVSRLQLATQAASERGQVLDHLLLSGPSGLGKTTLAGIVARSGGGKLITASGPNLGTVNDAVKVMAQIEPGSVVFIDEIHGMPILVEEWIYSALEDWSVDCDLGNGKGMTHYQLPRFTFIGATTRLGQLSAPLRNRFPMMERLEPYPAEDLAEIVKGSARVLGVTLTTEAALEIGRRGRGVARVANNLLRRVRDFAQVIAKTTSIDGEIAEAALDAQEIDKDGLNTLDLKILRVMAEYNRPVGLKAIAAAVNEDVGTIEDAHEGYLVEKGYILRGQRGRAITEKGKNKLKGL